MLELNTGYRISFVVDRIDVQLLKRYFEGLTFVFSTWLNEFNLIKIKKPFEDELSDIIEGRSKSYKERIEERLSYKICNMYDIVSVGDIPSSKPF